MFYSVIFPPPASSTPTLQVLSNELESVENWHLFGVKLGLQGYKLREIERNYGDNNRRKIEMLDLWLRNAKNPSWETVAEALRMMHECMVADGIQRKYCSSSTVTGKLTYWFSLDGVHKTS